MAGVAFAVEGDGVGFATESYAASALYTTLASLSANKADRLSAFTGDRECCAPAFLESDTMPAFQSASDLSLSRKYHLKAVRCEICAKNASDLTTEQECHELALQWHLMTDQAAKMSGEAALDELESAVAPRWPMVRRG